MTAVAPVALMVRARLIEDIETSSFSAMAAWEGIPGSLSCCACQARDFSHIFRKWTDCSRDLRAVAYGDLFVVCLVSGAIGVTHTCPSRDAERNTSIPCRVCGAEPSPRRD